MPAILSSRHCIVCGRENAMGMRLRFHVDAGGAEARWTPSPTFQGFAGVLHGGIVLALCDDAMWYAAFSRGAFTMTAEATVRYRGPVAIGAPVVVRGRVSEHRGRLWICAAELASADGGPVLATATGKFLLVPTGQAERLLDGTRLHEFPEAEPNGAAP